MTSRDFQISGESTGYFNPGGSGEFARTIPTLDRDLYATRRDLASGVDSLFRPNARGTFDVRIVVQGLNTSILHARAVDALIPGALGIIHSVTGDFTTTEARRSMQQDFIRPPIDTGLTMRSIHARLETTPDMIKTSVGPTTFYSPLIEFGLARHFTYGPRPFMSIAFATVLPHHLEALRQLAQVASGPRKRLTGKHHGPPTNNLIQRFRAFLYDAEKALGDAIPYVGLPFLRGPREAALGTARVLGDLQSVISHAIGARISARLTGKVTGRLIGVGSNTIFTSSTFTAITPLQRLYNAEAGKYLSRYVGQSNLLGGNR